MNSPTPAGWGGWGGAGLDGTRYRWEVATNASALILSLKLSNVLPGYYLDG